VENTHRKIPILTYIHVSLEDILEMASLPLISCSTLFCC